MSEPIEDVLPAAAVRRPRWRSTPAVMTLAGLLLAGVAGGGYLAGTTASNPDVATQAAARKSAVEVVAEKAAAEEAAAQAAAAEKAAAAERAAAEAAAAEKAAAEAAAAEKAAADKEAAEKAAAEKAAEAAASKAAAATKPPIGTATTPTTADTGGYTKADYEDRLDDIPEWIAKTRDSMSRGYTMSVGVQLSALGNRFDEVGRLPAPQGMDPGYWSASTTTLADFSRRAADEWRAGATTDASARFEVIIDNSNELIARANKALGLNVAQS